jgi:hypothetical protein
MILIQSNESTVEVRTASYPSDGLGTLIEVPASSGGTGPAPTLFFDSEVDESGGADTWTNYLVTPMLGATVTNLTPSVATLGEDYVLARAGGVGLGEIEFQLGEARSVLSYGMPISSGAKREFLGYAAGTVSAALQGEVETLIDSDPLKQELGYYGVINHASATYTRNANCWARAVDLSCLSVGTSHGSDSYYTTQRPGTLITPRHIVVANHYSPADTTYQGRADYVRFVTPGGVVRTRRVVGASGNFRDQKVLLLDASPTGCNPVKVADDWITQVVDGTSYSGGLLLSLNKNRQVGLSLFGDPITAYSQAQPTTYGAIPITGNQSVAILHADIAAALHPYVATKPGLWVSIVGGDSGSPCFAVVNGDPVLITCWFTANSGPCTWMGSGGNELLNAMISEADANAITLANLVSPTGYTVTVAADPTL